MRRLLVIEDDSNTLSGLIELLKDEGYEVQGARHGHEALKVIADRPIDMVLCDYSLPDKNGLQVCCELKKLQPGLILFLITAFYNSKLNSTAREYGIAKIFTKPLVLDDLFDVLLRYSNKFKNHKKNMSGSLEAL